MAFDKRLWRAAMRVHKWYAKSEQCLLNPALSRQAWQLVEEQLGRLNRALQKRWEGAVQRVRNDLVYDARSLQRELDKLAGGQDDAPTAKAPKLGEIYYDLVALAEEFEEVTFQRDARTLSVRTSRIILNEIDLGSFEIELSWHPHDSLPEYRVIARQPHPAGQDQSVTHPHVRDESLCEGDAKGAIRLALEHGRIYDFVTLVHCVLRTYAAGRAFIELDDWDGTRCSDCGSRMADRDSCFCDHCDAVLCSDCRSYCSQCDEGRCASCLSSCSGCHGDCCNSCLELCPGCQRRLCRACRDGNLCHECLEQGDEDCEQEELTERPANASDRESLTTDVEVQPDGLGEAALSA